MKIRVLIVEDDLITAQVLKFFLSTLIAEIDFYFATTKNQTIPYLSENLDLIILDGNLLDGSHGSEVLQEMTEDQISKTIVHSGHDDFIRECISNNIRFVEKSDSGFSEFRKNLLEMGII